MKKTKNKQTNKQTNKLACPTVMFTTATVNGDLSGCNYKNLLVFLIMPKRALYSRLECFVGLIAGGVTSRGSSRVWSGKDDPT